MLSGIWAGYSQKNSKYGHFLDSVDDATNVMHNISVLQIIRLSGIFWSIDFLIKKFGELGATSYKTQPFDRQSKSFEWFLYAVVRVAKIIPFSQSLMNKNFQKVSEAHSEPSRTSMMELFAKKITAKSRKLFPRKSSLIDI